jgi:hypothetical protein
MPELVASVITLAAPFRGVSIHPMILRAVNLVRGQIQERNGEGVAAVLLQGRLYLPFSGIAGAETREIGAPDCGVHQERRNRRLESL